MKAAVLHQFGQAPKFEDFKDPFPANDDQLLITVKAASVKNLDKGRASGAHYASYDHLPEVVGVDGAGILVDGTRVYAMGITGMIAEKALIPKNRYTVIPDGIDDATAAALPNAVIGAALALKFRAGMQAGKTVLINGATGVTGKIAVQIAKYYGAKKIIATGRNESSLNSLKELGADELISLKQTDETIIAQIKALHEQSHIDIVLDYTWGHPVELILKALKGGGLHNFSQNVRLVTVGSMAGESVALHSGILRSSDIEILGSGLGSLSKEVIEKFSTEILPELFQLAVEGKLKMDLDLVPLSEIETAWNSTPNPGRRMVITI